MIVQYGQILLVVTIIIFALYTFRLRTILLDRLIYLLLIGAGITFALRPELSSWLANRVGIGRGADLIIYTFILFSLFQMVSGVSHMNKMERQITALVRQCAILGATTGGTAGGRAATGGQAVGDPRGTEQATQDPAK